MLAMCECKVGPQMQLLIFHPNEPGIVIARIIRVNVCLCISQPLGPVVC